MRLAKWNSTIHAPKRGGNHFINQVNIASVGKTNSRNGSCWKQWSRAFIANMALLVNTLLGIYHKHIKRNALMIENLMI